MLILFLLSSVPGQSTCKKYSCKPSNIVLTSQTCIYSTSTNVYLQPCTGTTFCPKQYTVNSTCSPTPAPTKTLKYPGQPCVSNSDCIYPNCVSGICTGRHWLESCIVNTDCHVGLYCNKNLVCWPQLDEHSSCTDDSQCKNNMGCNYFHYYTKGECRKFYSLGNKEWVYDCKNYMSTFCKSGNCGGPGGKGICIDPIKPRYLNSECQSEQDCPGESFGWQYYSACECGYNEKGTKYCKPFLGDYLGLQYVKSISAWFDSSDILKCHTDNRMSFQCMSSWDGFKGYLKALYEYQNYAELQENDDCVKSIFTSEYWSLSK